jgi:predicted lysophospholipase L1 biosynthesis ABC-type transport system permease subunit
MYVFEYGLLGVIAGIVGSGGSLILTWLLTRQVLEISWIPVPLTTGMGVVLTAITVLVVGVISSIDVLRQKPLLTLRAE